MKRKTLILVLFAALGFCSCEKQTYNLYTTLAGTVVSSVDSEPLAGATVTLSPTGKSYTTGTNGAFEFQNMDAQQYTVTAQKSGYSTNRTTITGVAGEVVSITIPLIPNN